jgi:hypothetical protein
MTLRHARRIITADRARLVLALSAAAGTALVATGAAGAAWSIAGADTGRAKALSMPAGVVPTTHVSSAAVTVNWSPVTIGGVAVDHYLVRRYTQAGVVQSITAGCSGEITATTCTETSVPTGRWTYTTQPVKGDWAGPESTHSAEAEIAVDGSAGDV